MLCHLLGIRSPEHLAQHPQAGAVWETFVCGELRKYLSLSGRAGSLYFYRDRAKEVDFVVSEAGRFRLLEAKWAERPSDASAAQLDWATSQLGPKLVTDARVLANTLSGGLAAKYAVLLWTELANWAG